ncbi:MAG TPA: 6,7-dimethyl-8-ribityllumazine synthase [Flavobacteriales bacterium]|nr:6,7-dimethyl-8-ribityllumazine synthase [Flavobacteriales bacterium]HPH81696.1 6,7-dimethyl-8-ribityllumazine synthase [Flavobacteriales bacterium]
MSSAHQNLSSRKMVNITNIDHFRFTVIVAQWNKEVTGELEKGCVETLLLNGIPQQNIRVIAVPGSWELISAARLAVTHSQTDAVICIGAVIKGDTPHFEYICQGVTNGLATLCSTQDIPVIFGVLTVNTLQQALDRCGGIHGNKGDEAAITAIELAALSRDIRSKEPLF